MSPPLISLVMATYNTDPVLLEKTLDSVLAQTYPNWELCVADDASPRQSVRDVLQRYATRDSRIKVEYRKENGRVSAALNTALTLTVGEWIALLDHDDLLTEDALYWVADAIGRHPDARMMDSDEDKINELGEFCSPERKGQWNREFFFAYTKLFHLGVHHADLVRAVDGFRVGAEGSHGYDLAVRCAAHLSDAQIHHIPRILYHWRMPAAGVPKSDDYAQWIKKYDTQNEADRGEMRVRAEALESKPLFSILMSACGASPSELQATLASLQSQLYPHWELCLYDDGTLDAARALNQALARAKGAWVLPLRPGVRLAEQALYRVAEMLDRVPGVRLLYADEDSMDDEGRRYAHWFKCDWNPELFLSQNLIGNFGVYQTGLVREINGYRAGYDGAHDYDLALRYVERIDARAIVHIPRVLCHAAGSAAASDTELGSLPAPCEAGARALDDHLSRIGRRAAVEQGRCGYRVRYALPEMQPMVSIIIPTRNALGLMRQCVDSLLGKTTYPNYEVIVVDNGSDDPEALAYFEQLARRPGFRVIRDDSPFNYSALNNKAARVANGEILLLLNNDVEIIAPDWLDDMVSFAAQPGVGAVGAKLLYPNNTVQHAGVILFGTERIMLNQAHRQFPGDAPGYAGRASLVQNFLALSGACLMVKKRLYDEVGGLNEQVLAVGQNDIDFCLKLVEAGYRNIWTPHALLYHHESATRGLDDTPEKAARMRKENGYMMQRWPVFHQEDPAYNANLTQDYENFGLAWPPRLHDARS